MQDNKQECKMCDGDMCVESCDECCDKCSKNEKFDKYGNITKLYEEISMTLEEVFISKNNQYENSFMKFGRIPMRNEVMRKVARYASLFKEEEDLIQVVGNKSIIIPTMVDLANYAIMIILNELRQIPEEKRAVAVHKICLGIS